MHRLTALVIALCIALSILALPVQAQTSDPEEGDRANSWRYSDGKLLHTSASRTVSGEPSHPDATLRGIDVSHHQGKIDWEAVLASGVDFAIIRVGYGMDQTDQDDKYFTYNSSECERLGIPYGVYLYSYATTVERASSEADHVLRLIEGRNLAYPVYYDMEDMSTLDAELGAIAQTFCAKIENAGYPVGIYSSLDWWNTVLTDSCFDNWYRWVAQYNTACEYTGEFHIWQYSCTGSVSGISGNVDLNYLIGTPTDHNVCTLYHTYAQTVTPPTCTDLGYTTYSCTTCGSAYVGNYVDALGHTNGDGTCTVCGAAWEFASATPMYRLYNPNSGEHFYTGSIAEKDNLVTVGWVYEGIAWNAPVSSGEPVYRLYAPGSGDHHYTMSAEERDNLVDIGWVYEGVCWNSASADNLPLYRLYNPNATVGSHHYTGSEEERDYLVSLGWHFEGIGWFGMAK